MNYKEITRKKLYDFVWSIPKTTLSKQLNVKASHIKKVCIDFDIPTPKNGYWSKLKHGKKIEKSLLQGDFNKVIKLEINKQAKSKPILKVPKKLSKPDDLVTIAKKDLSGKEISHWHRAKGMVTTSKGILNITVTPKLVSRSLIFMDTFIKLAKQRGHTISHKEHYGTIITVYGIESTIYLREKSKRIIIKNNGLWNETELVPIGELVFKRDDYPDKEWYDSKKVKLEAKIPDIIQYFEEQAMQERANDIERELRREQQQRQQKIEEEIKQIRKNEIEKFNRLHEDSSRYRKAEQIRAFINAKRENAIRNNYLDASLENWIEWAKAKADWLDPIISKKDDTLGEYDDYK
ncbi:hypothetical protein [Confluentibacter flavum]|uniref:Uncharacterized protein n=1 Tax=Confluentibacter flavum TaxID=1909700 RepID=A0A2N3HLY3_9FLAO|nr:hypothetical protein [Confluentibacter flavum]PKQ45966.1 hypothetical protein CSW08_05975 [Confluentibacter flavum]